MKIEKKEEEKEEKLNSITIQHVEGINFEGIISYLKKKYGNDIHDQEIISISSSSTEKNKPEQVIDYNFQDFWCSSMIIGSWLEINFRQFKVKLNGYSLKSSNAKINERHLKNWIIEGSNDRGNWTEIDKKENNFDLNGPNYEQYFPISNADNFFQYIRIKNIGYNHSDRVAGGRKRLLFTNLEIYGEIMKSE